MLSYYKQITQLICIWEWRPANSAPQCYRSSLGSLGKPSELPRLAVGYGWTERGTVAGNRQTLLNPEYQQYFSTWRVSLRCLLFVFVYSKNLFIPRIWGTQKFSNKKECHPLIWETNALWTTEVLQLWKKNKYKLPVCCTTAKNSTFAISYSYQRGKLAAGLSKEVGLQSLTEHGKAQV